MPRKKPPRRRARQAPERPSAGKARGRPFPKGHQIGADTRFKRGQSGNPGGVPKDIREFRQQCRERTAKVLERWDDVLDHGSEEGIIKTGKELLANGWGSPTNRTEVTGANGETLKITYDDVRDKLTAMAERAVNAGNGTPPNED